MKQTIDRYAYVDLSLKNKKKKIGVHVLVMFEFAGPNLDGRQVCHRNDVKTDNRFENLYYGTASENKKDAYKNKKIRFGENHHNAKLSNNDVVKIRRLKSDGYKFRELSEMFNVSKTSIWQIVKLKTRTHEELP